VVLTVVQIPGLVSNGQRVKSLRPIQVEEVIKSGVSIEVTATQVQLVSFVGKLGLTVLTYDDGWCESPPRILARR
jgi:hypothetical protein